MNENRGLWRGKRIDNDEWVKGYLIKMWGKYHLQDLENENLVVEVDPSTLGECTIQTDMYGNPIFEGDIVNYNNGLVSEIFKVVYNEKWARFTFTKPNTVFATFNLAKCEVIGNIHDNPQLLQSTTGENAENAARFEEHCE